MRKATLLSAALVAALCVGPLAACGGGTTTKIKVNGKEFNAANYAAPVEEAPQFTDTPIGLNYAAQKKEYTVSLEDRALTIGNSSFDDQNTFGQLLFTPIVAVAHDDGTYGLYNVITGEYVNSTSYTKAGVYDDTPLSTYSALQNNTSLNTGLLANFFAAHTQEQAENGKVDLFAPNGEFIAEIMSGPFSYGFGSEKRGFVNNSNDGYASPESTEATFYFRLDYQTDAEGEKETHYFSFTVPLEEGKATLDAYENSKWTEIDAATYAGNGPYFMKKDTVLSVEKDPVYDVEKCPDMADYTWTLEFGTDYIATFYHGDEKVGTVTVPESQLGDYAFVGNYLYYTLETPVSTSAVSGYNKEVSEAGYAEKTNVTLYRYDFTKGGSAKEVKVDFVIDSLDNMYNYETKAYDKLYVTAYGLRNGVAVMNQNTSRDYALVLDENAKVSKDLSASALSSSTGAPVYYALKEGTYLYYYENGLNAAILNGDLDTVSTLNIPSSGGYTDSITVWTEGDLLVETVNGGSSATYVFVDYDGRLAYDAFTVSSGGDIYFANGAIMVKDPTAPTWTGVGSFSTPNFKVYSNGNGGALLSDILANELSDTSETTSYKLQITRDRLIELRTNADGKVTFEYFTFTGEKLFTLENVTSPSFNTSGNLFRINGVTYVPVTVDVNGESVQKTIVIK